MNGIAQRLTAACTAAIAAMVVIGAVLTLFAQADVAGAGRRHLPGGAGVAERYRALQATANDNLLCPRAGVTAFRGQPGQTAAVL